MPRVSVVLPVYNEARIAGRVFDAVLEFALGHPDYEFVFVDDCSTDDTVTILEGRLAVVDGQHLRLHRHAVNAGKGRAVRTGVELSQGRLICFTDGDLAYSLDHLPLLVDALELADVVIGSRSLVETGQRNIRLRRKVLGWVFNRCVRLILGLPYRDTQAGLKGFRAEAARAIFARQTLHDFAFDAEVIFLARRLGYRIAEVPARVAQTHSYKVSSLNLARDPWRMFGSLLRIRLNSWRGRYQAPPQLTPLPATPDPRRDRGAA